MHLLENTASHQLYLSDAIIHHLLTSFKVSAANHTARKQITDFLPVSHLGFRPEAGTMPGFQSATGVGAVTLGV